MIVGHLSGRNLIKDPENIREITSLGIGVEIQLTSDVLDSLILKEFGKIRKKAGEAHLTVHAPFMDLNPGALDPYILKATRDRFSEALTVARVLKAEMSVFHTGYHPAKVDPVFNKWFEKAVETFLTVAEESPCPIALENVFDETPEVLERFMERLPEKVGVCIDLGHLNLFSKVPLSSWFDSLGERIYEFHVHDNSGEKDEHAPVGKGNVKFDEFFSLLDTIKHKYIFNLENKSPEGIEESLRTLRRKGWLGKLGYTQMKFLNREQMR